MYLLKLGEWDFLMDWIELVNKEGDTVGGVQASNGRYRVWDRRWRRPLEDGGYSEDYVHQDWEAIAPKVAEMLSAHEDCALIGSQRGSGRTPIFSPRPYDITPAENQDDTDGWALAWSRTEGETE